MREALLPVPIIIKKIALCLGKLDLHILLLYTKNTHKWNRIFIMKCTESKKSFVISLMKSKLLQVRRYYIQKQMKVSAASVSFYIYIVQ